jgi:hypothetical protein
VKELQQQHGAPGVKQQLAAVRMLFDWLVTGQVLPMNPAAAVRGPKHVVKTGKTPVLDGAEWCKLLNSIPAASLRDLRDRALIATLSFDIGAQRLGERVMARHRMLLAAFFMQPHRPARPARLEILDLHLERRSDARERIKERLTQDEVERIRFSTT